MLLAGATAVLIQCKKTTTLLFVGSYTEGLPANGLKVYELNVKNENTKFYLQ